MVIERTSNEVIIRLPLSVNMEDLQELVNFLKYSELTSTHKIPQQEVDTLAKEVNTDWWTNNRSRFIR